MSDAPAKSTRRVPTTLLLICAAIGVAGGLLLAPANWLSTVLLAIGQPPLAVSIVGLWILPAVIALRLLRRPLVGLLVGVISGLVIVPFSGYGFMSVVTNASWALFAELPFLVVLWKFWHTWQHYAGAVLLGLSYPLFAWEFFDLGTMPPWVQIAVFASTMASCLLATFLGIFIADRLHAAGVARTVSRKS